MLWNETIRNNKKELSSILTKIRLSLPSSQRLHFSGPRRRTKREEIDLVVISQYKLTLRCPLPPFSPKLLPTGPTLPTWRVPHVNGIHVIAPVVFFIHSFFQGEKLIGVIDGMTQKEIQRSSKGKKY
jgi:hypothetical protein